MNRVRVFMAAFILTAVFFLIGAALFGYGMSMTDASTTNYVVLAIVAWFVSFMFGRVAWAHSDVLAPNKESRCRRQIEAEEERRRAFIQGLVAGSRERPIRCMRIAEGEETMQLFPDE